jgi:hypothetical protein
MWKKIVIITVVTLALVFGFIYFGLSPSSKNSSPGVGGSGSGSAPDYPYMDIQTTQGIVRIQDYFSVAKTITTYEVTLDTNDEFHISVFPQDNAFNIILLGHPLDKVQKDAEQKFLTLLKINEQNACKLNVKVGVPDSVDPRFSGQDFALSFCPSLPAPK